jgi:hypothetical protein
MQLKCKKCGSENYIKNGKVFGWQRYKCKDCGCQFTKVAPAGKPIYIKIICHTLRLAGLSMREIAAIIGVTAPSVSRWIRKWHSVYMHEIGANSDLYHATPADLADCLEIKENDNLLISSTILPSGAKFNIVIQLPDNTQKH